MTKNEIITLADSDPWLCRWCAVLFAEICDVVEFQKRNDGVAVESVYQRIAGAVGNFSGIVLAHSVGIAAKKADRVADLEARVEALESFVGIKS